MKRISALIICLLLCGSVLFSGCSGVSEVENQDYSIEYNSVVYEGSYSGQIENKVPSGQGKFSCGDPESEKYLIYEGEWTEGQISGTGTLSTDNYTVHYPETKKEAAIDRIGTYDGDVLDGIANGNGVFKATNSDGKEYIYEGEWKDGLFNGQGKRYYPNEKSYIISEGHFENGEFYPSAVEFIKSFGTAEGLCPYKLTPDEQTFISDNTILFTEHNAEEIEKHLIDGFSLSEFRKKEKTDKPGFVTINGLTIIQAQEGEVGELTYTYFLSYDDNFDYYLFYYLGSSDKLVEDATVNIIAMPLGYSTFEDTSGGNTWAVVGTAVLIK